MNNSVPPRYPPEPEDERRGSIDIDPTEADGEDIYEEYNVLSVAWSWALLIAFSASLLAVGIIAHGVIHDWPRVWNYGSLPDTPGSSVYATAPPPQTLAAEQMKPLPEAFVAPGERAPESGELPILIKGLFSPAPVHAPPDWNETGHDEALDEDSPSLEERP